MGMEVSRRRVKHLEPARPLKRLHINQVLQTSAEDHPNIPAEDQPANQIGVEQLYEIVHLHSKSQLPTKKERICYSREFLISVANSPMAKRKPEFLPEHPVVLEIARDLDLIKLLKNRLIDYEDRVA